MNMWIVREWVVVGGGEVVKKVGGRKLVGFSIFWWVKYSYF